jgi:hypothetical protein
MRFRNSAQLIAATIGRRLATTAITGCALAVQPSSRQRMVIAPSGSQTAVVTTIAGKPSTNQ